MNKKSGNLIASLVATISICSIVGATPVEATTAPHREVDYNLNNYKVERTYTFGVMTDSKGTMTQASQQALLKSNYLSGKIDELSEATIIDMFKTAGLTEADYYTLKTQREVTSSSNVAVHYGWAKNNDDKWYYSEDGHLWVVSDWKLINGMWYYFDSLGQAVTGWKQMEGKWYYFNSSCAMVSNTTIDGRTLGSDGILIQ